MSASLIVQYLGQGVAAARPATPAIDTGAIGLFFATDTLALTCYAGGSWKAVGGGYSKGTVPTVVQVAHENAGAQSVNFALAPTNGNLMVAMTFNSSTGTPGAGWTAQATNSTGLDFGLIATKVAGAGESVTQSPINSAPGTGCIVVWEIAGANGSTPVLMVNTQAEQSAQSAFSPALPSLLNCLYLGAIGLASSGVNNKTVYNVSQDVKDTTGGGRQCSAGHSDLSIAPTGQIITQFTTTGSYKGMSILITS